MNTTYIYALLDPDTEAIRYIGKSDNPFRRLEDHIREAKKGKTYRKCRWINSLAVLGKKPGLRILEICETSQWKERECYWIAYYRTQDCDLTNAKDGGDGGDLSEETRRKIGIASKGRAAHNRGKQTPLDIREKQRISAIARFAKMSSEERRQYMANRAGKNRTFRPSGWKHTEEAKSKISAASKGNASALGRKLSDEVKAKMSQSRIGHLVSDETKHKMSLQKRKLTEDQLSILRKWLEEKSISQAEMARRLDIPTWLVSNIKNGRSYRY